MPRSNVAYLIHKKNTHFIALREKYPYSITTTKQKRGSTNETFTAGKPATEPRSMMAPCNGGMSAPPTIAITRNAAPRVVSSSRTFSSAIPYIVGNMSDMKKLIATRQYRPGIPTMNMVPNVAHTAPAPNTASNVR